MILSNLQVNQLYLSTAYHMQWMLLSKFNASLFTFHFHYLWNRCQKYERPQNNDSLLSYVILKPLFQMILILLLIIFKAMGKKQTHHAQTPQNPQHESLKKKKPGRPINCQIQNLFISILRDAKLQAVNAEVQLELQMSFFTSEDQKKAKKCTESSVSDKWAKISDFPALNTDEKNKLHQCFDESLKNWKFEQIQQESDLQEYFFDDSTDIAIIIHKLINARKQMIQKSTFSQLSNKEKQNKCSRIKAEQLFYLCLLCQNSRQNLRDVVLEFLIKSHSLIVNILKASMEKAKLKYTQKVNRNKENHLPMEENQNYKSIKQPQIHAPVEESYCQNSSFSKVNSQKHKIKKPLKKINRQFLDSDDSQQPMTQKQKEQKLILCFVNYISWSYFYVFGEHEKPIIDEGKEQKPKIIENPKSP